MCADNPPPQCNNDAWPPADYVTDKMYKHPTCEGRDCGACGCMATLANCDDDVTSRGRWPKVGIELGSTKIVLKQCNRLKLD